MFSKLKNLFKKLLPPTIKVFMREVNGIRYSISHHSQKIQKTLEKHYKDFNAQNNDIKNMFQNQQDQIEKQDELFEKIQAGIKNDALLSKDRYLDIIVQQEQTTANIQKLTTQLIEQQKVITKLLESQGLMASKIDNTTNLIEKLRADEILNCEKKVIKDLSENLGISREILWSQIYNNHVSSSSWLKQNDFAPGRWAVGYPLLYVLYCILTKVSPQNILELGLGQSTHMITQYVQSDLNVKHLVIEQNKSWVDFFVKTSKMSPNTVIKMLDYFEDGVYSDKEKIRTYEGFSNAVESEKYDLILIDAPSYNGTSEYSRIDVLNILPDCLADEFVIILDDCNRPGEAKTAEEISKILKNSGIEFCEKAYRGEKIFRLWCSSNLSYLCTL